MGSRILISTITVGAGGAATIDFNSIPSTYTDLNILVSARSTSGNVTDNGKVRFNTSTSSYTDKNLYVDVTTVKSYTESGTSTNTLGRLNGGASTSNNFSNSSIYVVNYANGSYKSASGDAIAENNATSSGLTMGASLWSSTAAITSITLFPDTGNFAQYTVASLYGIKNS